MRDLKADLVKFGSMYMDEKHFTDKQVAVFAGDIVAEGFSRAIAAEELLASHAPEGHNVTNQQYIELRGENEQLSAQVVGLRDALGNFVNVEATRKIGKCKKCGETVQSNLIKYCYICSIEIASNILSSPDLGEKYRAQVAKMQEVVDAAKEFVRCAEAEIDCVECEIDCTNIECPYYSPKYYEKLSQTLAVLEREDKHEL